MTLSPDPTAFDRAVHSISALAFGLAGSWAARWFAVAFHVGRLLLDEPDDADLKRRRDRALAQHAGEKAP